MYHIIWARLVYVAHKIERKGEGPSVGHKIQFGAGKIDIWEDWGGRLERGMELDHGLG